MVLEQCVVSASPMWRAVFERLLAKMLDNNAFRCYMHRSNQSVYITTDTCKPPMDVYCICGRCGAEHSGQRRRTLATMAAVRHWPTFKYASENPYLTKKRRKQLAKERAKGKAVVGKHRRTKFCSLCLPYRRVVVVDPPPIAESIGNQVRPPPVPRSGGKADGHNLAC